MLQPEQISLNLLKRLTEDVMKLEYASKFHLIYKTLIVLFLNRAVLDETSYIVLAVQETASTKEEFMASVEWKEIGSDLRKLNSEVGHLFHEFAKLATSFVVSEGYVEDAAKVDQIWLELRKTHDSLLIKEYSQENA